MTDILTIKEVTRLIDAGEVFIAEVVSYDKKRKKGGEILYIEGQLAKDALDRPATPYEQRDLDAKAQYHHRHFTRNIALTVDALRTSMIRKIHPPLIIKFNGKTVIP